MSSEHSVACVTGRAIMDNLDPARYEVIPVAITADGVWTTGTRDAAELTMTADYLPQVKLREEIRLSTTPQRKGQFHFVGGDNAGQLYAEVDCIFPALHGRHGEDGTIQGLFELSGVPYVGCGVLASAVAMDKEYTKKILSASGLAVAPQVVVHPGDSLDEKDKQRLGLPVYVKPANGGSSIGVSKVDSWEDLDAALATAFAEDSKVLVESQITGPEVELGVLQYPDGTLLASPPAQLGGTTDSPEGFYGFETKYLAGSVTPTIPAPCGEDNTRLLKQMALAAFRALGCEGLARVDFFLTGNGPVVNEVNTMPGFTPISMYPQVLAAAGIDYQRLLDILIQRAMGGGGQ